MKLLTRRIPYESVAEGQFNLYPIGDIHLGSAACDEKALQAAVSRIAADPKAIVILMGDMIDAVGVTGFDKRSNLKTLASWLRGLDDVSDVIEEERDMAVNYLAPIADKIVAIVCGNHEDAVEHHRGFNIYWSMVERLAEIGGFYAPDVAIGYDGFLRLRFALDGGAQKKHATKGSPHVWTLDVYLHHGFGGGKMPGAKANNLWQLMATYDADLHLVGHTHELLTVSRQVVTPTMGNMPKIKTRWGVVCGSFHRAYIEPSRRGKTRETYSEVKGFPPLPIGYPIIHIDAGRQTYSVEQGTY